MIEKLREVRTFSATMEGLTRYYGLAYELTINKELSPTAVDRKTARAILLFSLRNFRYIYPLLIESDITDSSAMAIFCTETIYNLGQRKK